MEVIVNDKFNECDHYYIGVKKVIEDNRYFQLKFNNGLYSAQFSKSTCDYYIKE